MPLSAEASELERMWSDAFGVAYTARNAAADAHAGERHHALGTRLAARDVLEVGCNLGLNLTRMAEDPRFEVTGVDVCREALRQARKRLPTARFVRATAYRLPFAPGTFDWVFTCGVLIHLAPVDLGLALAELARVSRRYVWIGEYYSPAPEVVPYRGKSRALFKCDFGAAFRQSVPDACLRDTGFWSKAETGFDDLTWWLFEKA
jgi:pseudaminic acid biosynthesis-associated methylase